MTAEAGIHIEFQGATTKDAKPFVLLLLDGEPSGQLTPGECLNHGIRAVQAASEAERDAGFVSLMRELKVPDEKVVAMLTLLREHRQQVDPDPRNDVSPGSEERGV